MKPFAIQHNKSLLSALCALALWLSVGSFWSCERRSLEDEAGITALVPFQIDWSASGLELSEIRRASIWFFPHDGTPSFEWRMESDLNKTSVPLPVGKYSIVVFNETTDETDWNSILFGGHEAYETFHVYTSPANFRGLYSKADVSDIRKTPDAVASWSIDEFEVTAEMVIHTRSDRTNRSAGNAVTKSLEKLSAITPRPLTVSVMITAYVENLRSALRCSAALVGATGRVSLATRKPINEVVTHLFGMNNRKYDIDNPSNGTIEAQMLLFQFIDNEIEYELQVDFELHGGTKVPTEYFDITDQIDKEKATVEVNIGISESGEEDHPIVLPKVEVGNDVGVDGWDDVEIPIK